MRLTTVILIASLMQVSANSLAQKITLSKSNAGLPSIFKELKAQSGYNFFYTDNLLKDAKPVTIKVNSAEFEDVLKLIFADQPFSYEINSKTVVIKEKAKEPSFLDNLVARFTAVDVRGRVVDEQGNPLPNASIQVKGKAQVYNSNDKGEFSIPDVADDAILVIRYVGYKMLEISVKDAVMPLEIKLNVATGELEEVKVVYNTGYQKIDAGKTTGSFVQIDNELFNRSKSINVIERIYKVTNGLVFNSSEKNQSSVPRLQIRGVSTINANKDPLIVIDNFPYEGDVNNLNLNPNDIENITVLKDAAAAAIWGMRAGNGVIVITTKKGKYNQATKVSITSDLTITEKPDLFYIPSISSADMIAFEKEQFAAGLYNDYDDLYPLLGIYAVVPEVAEILLAKRNGKITQVQADSQIAALEKNDIRNDINKFLLQNAISQQYSFNISGGGNSYNYIGSIGYNNNRLNSVGDNAQKLTVRFSNSWKPFKNLEIAGEISYIKSDSESGGNYYNNLISGIGRVSPYTRLADQNGNALAIPADYRAAYIDTARYPALLDWHYRPLDELKENIATTRSNDIRMNTTISYTILSGLNALLEYQYQKGFSDNTSIISPDSYSIRHNVNTFMNVVGGKVTYPYPLGSKLNSNIDEQNYWNLRGRLSYGKRFGDHVINFQAGSELRENRTDVKTLEIIGYNELTGQSAIVDNNTLFLVRPDNSTRRIGVTQPKKTYRLFRNGSYFTLGSYTFMDKYFITGSARIDQANFLGVKANGRRVPLWSAGLGWELSKADFYKMSWLPYLKLRTTYGYQGNTIPSQTVLPTITYSPNSTTGVTNARISSPPLPNLRWEKSRMINLAVDFASFNNRLSGSLDFYWKKGTDLIQGIAPDATSGIINYNANYADMKGKGLDIGLNSLNSIGAIKWNTNFNFSFNTNRVTSYKVSTFQDAQSYVSGTEIEGEPLYQIRSFNWAGLDPLTGTPRITIDGVISDYLALNNAKLSDLVYQGTLNPKFAGNILNNFSWRQLSLSFNVSYKLNYSFRRSSYDYGQNLMDNWGGHSDYSKRWQNPGDELITNVPVLASYNSYQNIAYSSSNILVEKGDHFRLEDVQIGYDFTRQAIRNLPFNNIRISFLANNLGLLWKANKSNIDPDAYRFGVIPVSKSFSLSVHANF